MTDGETFGAVVGAVSTATGVLPDQIHSRSRVAEVALARMVAMYVLRTHYAWSLQEIGRRLGRDHSTVFSAVRKMERLCASHSADRELVNDVLRLLGSPQMLLTAVRFECSAGAIEAALVQVRSDIRRAQDIERRLLSMLAELRESAA